MSTSPIDPFAPPSTEVPAGSAIPGDAVELIEAEVYERRARINRRR